MVSVVSSSFSTSEVTTVSDVEKDEETTETITEIIEDATTLEPEVFDKMTTTEPVEEVTTTLKPIEPRLLDEEEQQTTTFIPEISTAPEAKDQEETTDPETITTTLTSTTEAETEVPTIISTASTTSTTSTTPISIPELDENLLEDEEVLEVEEPDEGTEEPVHTLQCLPDSAEIDGQIAMKCKEAAEAEPITVLISAKGLDLTTLARKNVKIVVKDYMLMEMQQRPVAVKPRRRR